jgi:hypothetical protein
VALQHVKKCDMPKRVKVAHVVRPLIVSFYAMTDLGSIAALHQCHHELAASCARCDR